MLCRPAIIQGVNHIAPAGVCLRASQGGVHPVDHRMAALVHDDVAAMEIAMAEAIALRQLLQPLPKLPDSAAGQCCRSTPVRR